MCHMTTAMALSMVALLSTDGSRRVALDAVMGRALSGQLMWLSSDR